MTYTHYIGVMSGTSLDGIDAALLRQDAHGWHYLDHYEHPMPDDLRHTLYSLYHSGHNELERAAQAAAALAEQYSHSVHALLRQSQYRPEHIRAIGAHGQTVRHCPDATPPYTIQLLNPALLAERTHIDTIADFRSRDLAAGGQGAPLAPLFHRALLNITHGCIINIGGIANLSIYEPGHTLGFDSGPGNGLMDAWIHAQHNQAYDAHGQWAARGQILPDLLQRALADPYFQRSAPKSTGRDHFNLTWLRRLLHGDEAPADVQRTLLELTATTISNAVHQHSSSETIIIAGGGSRNPLLMQRLREQLHPRHITPCPIPSQALEAAGFAWLAAACCARQAHHLHPITGGQTRILGALYPA